MGRLALFFFAICLMNCGNASKEVNSAAYFDIKGYFEMETANLLKAPVPVYKSVSRNGTSETKADARINWQTELALFSESDINKPAWKTDYKIAESLRQTTYTALDSSLRTRTIEIRRDDSGKPSRILIINHTRNFLYQTMERLLYIPDSVYEIKKQQHVLLMGSNTYTIIGKFR